MFILQRLVLAVYTGSLLLPPKDHLSSTAWWRLAVLYQRWLTSNKHYQVCLFGDSITAQLGNNFGKDIFNFAIGGMSTISLAVQLNFLASAKIQCHQAIVAIGTNDAWYGIDDDLFIQLLKKTILLLKLMGAKQVVLIPAFYSTVAASGNPYLAANNNRIDRINDMISKIAASEDVFIGDFCIQDLFDEQALKDNLTNDGVHLNAEGLKIYRQALFQHYIDGRAALAAPRLVAKKFEFL